MDLAKIRQKARHDRELLQQQNEVVPLLVEPDIESVAPVDTVALLPDSSIISRSSGHLADIATQFNISTYESNQETNNISSFPIPARDPLEVILAGRSAAGCDEDLPLASNELDEVSSSSYMEFICFRVSDEFYGINIMDIKEIIKPREATEVPRAPSFVAGVISLRGIIIPIIDMLDRLGLSRETLTGRERVIVVKLKDGLSGLLVDEIVHVVRIEANSIEQAPAILDGIDRDFVSGIGRADGKMIIILNLETVADINLF